MNFQSATAIVRELHDGFPSIGCDEHDERRWVDFFCGRKEADETIVGAVRNGIANRKRRTAPSKPEVGQWIDAQRSEDYGRSDVRKVYARVAELRMKYPPLYLTMFAKPSPTPCAACVTDYVDGDSRFFGRGIHPDNPYLLHEHFTIYDLDADVALEVAIGDAQRDVRNPLEVAATKKTKRPEAPRVSLEDEVDALLAGVADGMEPRT